MTRIQEKNEKLFIRRGDHKNMTVDLNRTLQNEQEEVMKKVESKN